MQRYPKCPDLKNLSPGEAKRVLTEHLLDIFEKAPLNYHSNTTFDFAGALQVVEGDGWGRKIVAQCYEAAEREWEHRHPKSWSNELQKATRRGMKTPE
jgi:hypothetical protein